MLIARRPGLKNLDVVDDVEKPVVFDNRPEGEYMSLSTDMKSAETFAVSPKIPKALVAGLKASPQRGSSRDLRNDSFRLFQQEWFSDISIFHLAI